MRKARVTPLQLNYAFEQISIALRMLDRAFREIERLEEFERGTINKTATSAGRNRLRLEYGKE